MTRYKRLISTDYDWSDETDANKAFENAYIVDEESFDGEWVKWDDVQELEESHKELLEALQLMVDTYDSGERSDATIYRCLLIARDAIVKAKGTK